METEPVDVHRRFVDEVVVGKQIDRLDDLFTVDAVLEQGSLDALRAQMAAQAQGLDVEVSFLHEFTDGDWVIHHLDLRITHVGEFMGRSGSGGTWKLAAVTA